jgi:hypothetical protein
MGQQVYIKAKIEEIDNLNNQLKTIGINNSFVTADNNQRWLNSINNDPESLQRHLKPKDRDLTMDELLKLFPLLCEVGLLSFDVAFSRTTDEEAQMYAEFIQTNKDIIDYLKGADELISRYKLNTDHIEVINLLNKPYEDPQMLPIEEQYKPDLQSGLFLCKSFSTKPFWVIFGKVDQPQFLKERIYVDDLHNRLYRDKQGYGYLLLPQLPINNKQIEFVQEIYDYAYQMGLRENYNLIIPFIYGLDVINYDDVANNYLAYYTNDELKERFYTIFKYTVSLFSYGYFQGIVWDDRKKQFKPTGSNITIKQLSLCSILTCLLRALGSDIAAELMTKLLNRKFIKSEF